MIVKEMSRKSTKPVLFLMYRNEATRIEPLIDSLASKNMLDGVFAHDTGSTDSTGARELQAACKRAGVQLVQKEVRWVGFGRNRTVLYHEGYDLLQRMRVEHKWIIVADADWTYTGEPWKIVKKAIKDNHARMHGKATAVNNTALCSVTGWDVPLHHYLLFKGPMWSWTHPIHHELVWPQDHNVLNLEDVVTFKHMRSKTIVERNQKALLEGLYENDRRDTHTLFYLVKLYYDLGLWNEVLMVDTANVINMRDGYASLLHCMRALAMSKLAKFSSSDVLKEFELAQKRGKSRPEPYYYRKKYLIEQGRYQEAMKVVGIPSKKAPDPFAAQWMNDYGLLWLQALLHHKMGFPAGASSLFNFIPTDKLLPIHKDAYDNDAKIFHNAYKLAMERQHATYNAAYDAAETDTPQETILND